MSKCLKSKLSCAHSIEKAFGTQYDENAMYFIVIQGPTSAGKTTLSKYIVEVLRDFNPFLLSLDNFYDFPYNSKDELALDYDNPNMLNWTNIFTVINSLIQEDEEIPVYTRPGESLETFYYIKNPKSNIFILEGVYAFNCLNDVIFNLDKFDQYNSSKELINEYIPNTNIKLSKKPIKVFNLLLTQNKNKLYQLRIQKDSLLRDVNKKEVIDRLDKFTWPGTLRWVYSSKFKRDYVIKGGNFNKREIINLKNNLKNFFKNKF